VVGPLAGSVIFAVGALVAVLPSTPGSARRGKHLVDLSCPAIELVVQVDRGADQRQMAEGLREVADLLAGREAARCLFA